VKDLCSLLCETNHEIPDWFKRMLNDAGRREGQEGAALETADDSN
jgi:hypothetical protein